VGVLEVDEGAVSRLARAVAAIAGEEGLRAHAHSALLRLESGADAGLGAVGNTEQR
jgi:histidinol dehydrogenase